MIGNRVVVTGMGAIGPIGNTVAEVWESASHGRSGIDFITQFDTSVVVTHIAGEVTDFDPAAYLDRKTAKRTDRSQQFALIAAAQALRDSGLEITDDNAYDIGAVFGTGIGGIRNTIDTVNRFASRGHRGVSPTLVPSMLSDQIASQVSMDFNLRGPNYSIISACSSGNNAIGDAADMIRLGRAKAILAGGSEACINEVVLAGFNNIKALTHAEDDPTRASRPFDLHREGFVPGEGAGVLVLEELEHARARGATIYAEFTGYGHTSDAYHVTAPSDDGVPAAKAMQKALSEAGLAPEDIDYINAHGTGTTLNDKSETLAIKRAFGEAAYNVPISSTKSMTGHMMGAASAFEAIIAIMAMQHHFAPPTINLDTPDPECDLDYVPNVGRAVEINHVMNNSFGFGGHNAVTIFSRYAPDGNNGSR